MYFMLLYRYTEGYHHTDPVISLLPVPTTFALKTSPFASMLAPTVRTPPGCLRFTSESGSFVREEARSHASEPSILDATPRQRAKVAGHAL